MPTFTPELRQPPFTRLECVKTTEAARGLGRAVITLFIDPPHDRTIWEEAEERAGPQPVQPPVQEIRNNVRRYAASGIQPADRMHRAGLLNLATTLIQFTDHSPRAQYLAKTPSETIFSLYKAIAERAAETEPLSFSDQLGQAVEQANGELPDALWRIFLTSRLLARWRDVDAIEGLPQLSRKEKIDLTERWQSSIAACKPFDTVDRQDVIGDTYYCWTHALAKYAFGNMAADERAGRLLQKPFHNGTTIMQAFANSPFNFSIGTVSDHKTAAHYGNAIGEALSGITEPE